MFYQLLAVKSNCLHQEVEEINFLVTGERYMDPEWEHWWYMIPCAMYWNIFLPRSAWNEQWNYHKEHSWIGNFSFQWELFRRSWPWDCVLSQIKTNGNIIKIILHCGKDVLIPIVYHIPVIKNNLKELFWLLKWAILSVPSSHLIV